MGMRAIYRSYGGENLKNRPAFYSKTTALLSFLRAAERTDVDVVFMNDGPVPAETLRIMRDRGEIVQIGPGAGLRGSWMAMVRLAASWDPDQVVWFSEDDYLYAPEALEHFAQAVNEMPDVDYFALYGSTDRHSFYGDLQRSREPRNWLPVTRTIDGHDWVRIYATTSSFGARSAALAEDMGIVRLSMVPHKKMFRDRDLMVMAQGYEPHRWSDLARAMVGLSTGSVKQRLREAALTPFLAASNIRSHRRTERRRLLMAADPNLATHMETGLLAPGADWVRIADEARAWGAEAGLVEDVG